MRLSYAFILYFLFNTLNQSFGQEVNWSPVIESASVYPLGITNDRYFIYSNDGREGNILSYYLNHKLISKERVGYNFGGLEAIPSPFIETISGKYIVFTAYDRSNSKVILYAATFNDGKLGEPFKMHSHKLKTQLAIRGNVISAYSNKDNFQEIVISEDKSKVAYMQFVTTKDGNKAEELSISVFDQDFKKLWSKTKFFPYADKNLLVEQMILTNEGNVLVSAKLKVIKGGLDNNTEMKLFSVLPDTDVEYDLQLRGKNFIVEFGLFSSVGNEIRLGGTYSNPDFASRVLGVFYGTYDLMAKKLESNISPFTKTLLTGLVTDKAIAKGKGLKAGFEIISLHTFPDGSTSFVAEYANDVSIGNRTAPTPTVESSTYLFGNTIIPRFSKEGDLIKVEKIEKDFQDVSRIHGSIACAERDGELCLIFNSRKEKNERKELGLKGLLSSSTDMITIGKNGKKNENKIICSPRNTDYKTKFTIDGFMNYDDKFLLLGVKWNTYQIGIIEL